MDMSDSEKTNDLDNYGVWVKKPPRTVSSENTTDSQEFEFPDFSASDIIDNTPFDSGDTALSATELSALTDDPGTQISQIEEPPVDSIEDTPFEADFLSQDNPAMQRFLKAAATKAVPNDWIPTAKVHMYSAKDDTYVPRECSDQLYNFLKKIGADVDYTLLEGNHTTTGLTMGLELLERLLLSPAP